MVLLSLSALLQTRRVATQRQRWLLPAILAHCASCKPARGGLTLGTSSAALGQCQGMFASRLATLALSSISLGGAVRTSPRLPRLRGPARERSCRRPRRTRRTNVARHRADRNATLQPEVARKRLPRHRCQKRGASSEALEALLLLRLGFGPQHLELLLLEGRGVGARLALAIIISQCGRRRGARRRLNFRSM